MTPSKGWISFGQSVAPDAGLLFLKRGGHPGYCQQSTAAWERILPAVVEPTLNSQATLRREIQARSGLGEGMATSSCIVMFD
jgi:hypothetical protein